MALRTGVLALLVVVVALTAGFTHKVAAVPSAFQILSLGKNGEERAKCIDTTSICYKKILTCPQNCKKRSTEGKGPKACYIDCGETCKTYCKHRKPNCYGDGAVCYDPRLVGGDGTVFYFHGRKNEDFCLVSDRRLHINGHFIGHRPEGRKRDFTWVQAVGLLFGDHKFFLAAKKVPHWDDAVDQILFSYDQLPFALEEESGAIWTSEDGQLSVQRTSSRNAVEVVVDEMMSLLVEVVPITADYSKVHNYQLPGGDAFAHLDLQFKFFNLSANVNGVLGETYQPNYVSRAKVGVKMPVLGGEDRFFATGLLNADCQANQFSPGSPVDALEILEPFRTECSSKNSGMGIVCRR